MKRIPGYKNYSVSEDGKVFSHNMNKLMSLVDNGYGYMMVNLWSENKRRNFFVHKLVATCYIENKNGYTEINHIDGNKKNNHYLNLEWTTRKMNMEHAVESGLSSRGTKSKRNKTGYVGVCFSKNGKYMAYIAVNGKDIGLGLYDDPISAAIARDIASIKYHGDTGKLNFPNMDEK